MKTLFLGFLPVVGALLGLLFFGFVMHAAKVDRARGYKNTIRPDEVHHAYLGVIITAVSFLSGLEGLTVAVVPVGWLLAPILRWAGVVLIWDDDYEHTMQLGGQADYESAIHRFANATVFRIPGVTRLVALLDKLLHKFGVIPPATAAAMLLFALGSCGGSAPIPKSPERHDTAHVAAPDTAPSHGKADSSYHKARTDSIAKGKHGKKP